MVKFFNLDVAYEFVSSEALGMNSAILCKETGQIFYQSDDIDSDEFPEDFEDNDKYIEIPNKRDLNLGNELVYDFMLAHLPDKADTVKTFFRSKGAYARFKEFLTNCGALDQWHEYEKVKTESALRAWCAQNDIVIEE